jgi:lipopolysaccharide/colanic/teichoic acid biosynthesis glycosyltransferase
MNVHRISAIQKASVNHRAIANNGIAQLLGGLVVAVGLPFLVFGGTDFAAAEIVQRNVLYATLAAVLVGHYFFRRFVFFPGARSSSYVVPTFTATYAIALTVFFFFRIDYSRLAFATSFVMCESWYFACHVMGARARPRRLAVVPVGKARKVNRIPKIDWIWLRESGAPLPECDGIVVDLRADLSDDWERFIAERAISGVPVYHVKQIEESVTGRVDIEHLSENSFGSLVPGLGYIKIKQLIDFGGALVVGLVLLPVLLLVALAIKLDSRGPALFKQKRVGYRGVPITVYKFRTMRHEALVQTERDSAITQDGDARITRLGRYLRHSRIDELPQIINILRGEMSWIGPRPEACALSEWYESEIPFYRYRHIVHPGITGWAQVNQGHVAGVADVLDKLQFDFYYIKYFSPWLDMLIVLRTIRTMLTGFGSK